MSAIEQQHGAGTATGANGAASQAPMTRPDVEPPASWDTQHTDYYLLDELLTDEQLPEPIAHLIEVMAHRDPNERYANAHNAMCALVRTTMT